MIFDPQHAGGIRWIDAGPSPPSGFTAAAVGLAMMSAT
jgi:hypothetical protein